MARARNSRSVRQRGSIDELSSGALRVRVYARVDPVRKKRHDDCDVRQEFSICFRARPTGGALRESDESSEVRWVRLDDLGLDLLPSIRLRIDHALSDRAEAFYN